MHLYAELTPLQIDDPRMSTDLVHRHLRELIYSGALPGGAVLSQLQLARALGVSRTPLREAFRTLQEEGLIEAEPNHRSRVAGVDSVDLDVIYGNRLMLEALGMRLTLPSISRATQAQAQAALAQMEDHPDPTSEVWREAHARFHGAFTSGAPAPLSSQIGVTAHRATRYITLLASGHPLGSPLSAQDHRAIMGLVAEGSHEEAIAHTARHLARTALMVLADIAADFEPVTIRSALALIIGSERPSTASAVAPVSRLQRRTS